MMLSLFVLLFPMVVTMVVWLETGVWWRFAVVFLLSMTLVYWQMIQMFRAQDRRAIERVIAQ